MDGVVRRVEVLSDVDSSARRHGIGGSLPSCSKLSHDAYGVNKEYREGFVSAERGALLTLSQVQTTLKESKFSQRLEADLHNNLAMR